MELINSSRMLMKISDGLVTQEDAELVVLQLMRYKDSIKTMINDITVTADKSDDHESYDQIQMQTSAIYAMCNESSYLLDYLMTLAERHIPADQ